MGVELHIACEACRSWAWLGSAKSWKWSGFQVGNAAVVGWLVDHAHAYATPGCLELWRGDGDLPPWDADPSAWKEDERSLGVKLAGRAPAISSSLDAGGLRWVKTLWLRCERCGGERAVALTGDHVALVVEGTALADWLFDHTAPACSLTGWLSAT